MHKLALTVLMLPLAACVRFGAEPPPSLLTLTAAAEVPVGRDQQTEGARSITIAVPTAPQELAVTRVPVHATDTSIAYVKDAQWIEPPARLFARLLADMVAARTDLVVLGGRQQQAEPGAVLNGELREFGVDAGGFEVVVVYDAALARAGKPGLDKRRFEARVPLGEVKAEPVGVALNAAANQVAAEVAAWVAR